MPPSPVFRFGNNALTLTEKDKFTIIFVHGAQWTFDTKEIKQLDRIASDFQTEWIATIRNLSRTKGGTVHFEYWLQHIFLYENKREAYFLDSELTQLRTAISGALADQEVRFPKVSIIS